MHPVKMTKEDHASLAQANNETQLAGAQGLHNNSFVLNTSH